jgi:hypothetical protein
MKTLLALLLCLFVLLSGCITANTVIFEPEPDSGGDWFVRIWGGIWDGAFGGLAGLIVAAMLSGSDFGPSWIHSSEAAQGVDIGMGLGIFILIPIDVVIGNSLPYRKAYFQDKEVEEETTEPDEESSKQTYLE